MLLSWGLAKFENKRKQSLRKLSNDIVLAITSC